MRLAGRRLLAFQPHRYTRTRDCFEDFVRCSASADAVLLTEVYAAGEAPMVAADGDRWRAALRVAGRGGAGVRGDGDLPRPPPPPWRRTATWCCAWARGSIGAMPGKWLSCYQIQSPRGRRESA